MATMRILLCYYIAIAAIYVDISQTAQYYTNPLIPKLNKPDPGVHVVGDRYWVATTTDYNTDPNKFPIVSSDNFLDWKEEGWIFPKDHVPRWASQDFWAPEIHFVDDNYVVYYVAREAKTGVLAVGAAFSETGHIRGPYHDIGHPLVFNISVGSIDPTTFVDEQSGSRYLLWKEDGNGCNPPEKYTPIWARKLKENGLEFAETDKHFIIQNDPDSWEGPLVEAPWVIRPSHTSDYFLFYSANGYAGPKYAVGVARSSSLLGPYKKYAHNPILHTNSAWDGPGHCSVVRDAKQPSEYLMFYHSWVHGQILNGHPRVLMMDKVIWTQDGWPIINGSSPSIGPTPIPPF